MEKTHIAPGDKRRAHLSSNGACAWITESQLLLTYTVCLLRDSATQFHASPFIKLKYSTCIISSARIIYARKRQKHTLYLQRRMLRLRNCNARTVKQTTKTDLITIRFWALAGDKQHCSQTFICSQIFIFPPLKWKKTLLVLVQYRAVRNK